MSVSISNLFPDDIRSLPTSKPLLVGRDGGSRGLLQDMVPRVLFLCAFVVAVLALNSTRHTSPIAQSALTHDTWQFGQLTHGARPLWKHLPLRHRTHARTLAHRPYEWVLYATTSLALTLGMCAITHFICPCASGGGVPEMKVGRYFFFWKV